MHNLITMDRIDRDIRKLIRFVGLQPRGKPEDRKAGIHNGIIDAWQNPLLSDIGYTNKAGVPLRRWNASQFAIIYSFDPPSLQDPKGTVWIRAIKHSRVKNVFFRVREVNHEPYTAEVG